MQRAKSVNSGAADEPPLASCLCVTEGREAFLPWLLWNYEKQDYEPRELVVVDSSSEPAAALEREGVIVVPCPPGTTVARKRNLAVDAARGSLVAWFDDDDWQHPRRLSILAEALGRGHALAGSRRSWFVDLGRGRARPHESERSVIFNGVGVRRTLLEGVRFDERRARAADTAWLAAVRSRTRSGVGVVPEILSCWLCHAGNLSNPVTRHVFPHPIATVRDAVGADAWDGTDEQLAALRDRLVGANPG